MQLTDQPLQQACGLFQHAGMGYYCMVGSPSMGAAKRCSDCTGRALTSAAAAQQASSLMCGSLYRIT